MELVTHASEMERLWCHESQRAMRLADDHDDCNNVDDVDNVKRFWLETNDIFFIW